MPQKLREWVRRHEADAGTRQGVTTVEHECVKAPERENGEPRRAHTILKLASAFFPGGARPPTQVLRDFISVNAARIKTHLLAFALRPTLFWRRH